MEDGREDWEGVGLRGMGIGGAERVVWQGGNGVFGRDVVRVRPRGVVALRIWDGGGGRGAGKDS